MRAVAAAGDFSAPLVLAVHPGCEPERVLPRLRAFRESWVERRLVEFGLFRAALDFSPHSARTRGRVAQPDLADVLIAQEDAPLVTAALVDTVDWRRTWAVGMCAREASAFFTAHFLSALLCLVVESRSRAAEAAAKEALRMLSGANARLKTTAMHNIVSVLAFPLERRGVTRHGGGAGGARPPALRFLNQLCDAIPPGEREEALRFALHVWAAEDPRTAELAASPEQLEPATGSSEAFDGATSLALAGLSRSRETPLPHGVADGVGSTRAKMLPLWAAAGSGGVRAALLEFGKATSFRGPSFVAARRWPGACFGAANLFVEAGVTACCVRSVDEAASLLGRRRRWAEDKVKVRRFCGADFVESLEGADLALDVEGIDADIVNVAVSTAHNESEELKRCIAPASALLLVLTAFVAHRCQTTRKRAAALFASALRRAPGLPALSVWGKSAAHWCALASRRLAPWRRPSVSDLLEHGCALREAVAVGSVAAHDPGAVRVVEDFGTEFPTDELVIREVRVECPLTAARIAEWGSDVEVAHRGDFEVTALDSAVAWKWGTSGGWPNRIHRALWGHCASSASFERLRRAIDHEVPSGSCAVKHIGARFVAGMAALRLAEPLCRRAAALVRADKAGSAARAWAAIVRNCEPVLECRRSSELLLRCLGVRSAREAREIASSCAALRKASDPPLPGEEAAHALALSLRKRAQRARRRRKR